MVAKGENALFKHLLINVKNGKNKIINSLKT